MSIADGITAFSAVVAAAAFVFGVSAWKREFLGKREIELAEEALALAYEIEEIVRGIRSPFASSAEGQSREPRPNETEEEAEFLNRAYVVIERFNRKEDRVAKFQSLKFRYKSTFGPESEQPFNEIIQAINEIFVSAQMLGSHYWPRQGRAEMGKEEFQKHLDEKHKHEAIFWDMGTKRDEIGPKIKAAVEKFETIAGSANQRRVGHLARLRKLFEDRLN